MLVPGLCQDGGGDDDDDDDGGGGGGGGEDDDEGEDDEHGGDGDDHLCKTWSVQILETTVETTDCWNVSDRMNTGGNFVQDNVFLRPGSLVVAKGSELICLPFTSGI